ncbi:hypothetical protein [Desulfosporosinus sp. FKB]|uniref:hypothetical protein n=1 Tax=Desulfosporosinus sp. FKB TaxID=1969835 RepID=UPI000B4A19F3|nr:hypothetical protein [Desulfosporosinus sp. FKB]
MQISIGQSILIGICGGAGAGIAVFLFKCLLNCLIYLVEENRIYKWLEKNTENADCQYSRKTLSIACYNNLSVDRVIFVASKSKRIFHCYEENDIVWTIYDDRKANSTDKLSEVLYKYS